MKGQKQLFSSKSDEWATPQKLFDELNDEFDFTLDAAATKENAKCKTFCTKENDGLSCDWKGHRVFCNPPYTKNQVGIWLEKAAMACSYDGVTSVFLVPARTDTRWFHDRLWDRESHRPWVNISLRFLKGRLKFGDSKNSAPFPSMIVIFR
jgi:phage N-6-adenine-methyltransferase